MFLHKEIMGIKMEILAYFVSAIVEEVHNPESYLRVLGLCGVWILYIVVRSELIRLWEKIEKIANENKDSK